MSLSVAKTMLIWTCIKKIKNNTSRFINFMDALTEFHIGITNLNRFLLCEEIDKDIIQTVHNNDSTNAIEFNNCNFMWGFNKYDEESEKNKEGNEEKRKCAKITTFKHKIALKNINLKIKKGEFVAIVGDVGSGKSSLIYSLLGEMCYVDPQVIIEHGDTVVDYKKTDDTIISPVIDKIVDSIRTHKHLSKNIIKIDGNMSLAEQRPFILSRSIRENILFGEELDEEKYNKTLEACQLGRDLEILTGGDLTQLGEKGITLSGGQKARVSLARAVYSGRDIVLMDDPLSAFDAHVKKAIFDEVCCGILKSKTRIVVTHAVDFLDRVDRIIVMKNGEIMLSGTYSELLKDEYFKNMMKTVGKHDKTEESSGNEDTDETVKNELVKNHMSLKGKDLLKKQSDEESNIDLNTYYEFLSYIKSGIPMMILFLLISTVAGTGMIKVNYMFLSWVKNFTKDGGTDYDTLYSIIYLVMIKLLIETISSIIEIAQNHILYNGLFKNMLKSLLNAPVNLFYDITPMGIINSRMSDDLETSSKSLPNTLKRHIKNYLDIAIKVIFVCYNAPYCIFIIPVTIFLLTVIFKEYIGSTSQLQKLK
jgi:ATP-binding cassette subfamily C (CFTR/MRP) protein 1